MPALKTAITEFSAIARSTGMKAKSWGPTAAAWGGGLTLLGLYLTEWRVVTDYIPYYNQKYKHEVPR